MFPSPHRYASALTLTLIALLLTPVSGSRGRPQALLTVNVVIHRVRAFCEPEGSGQDFYPDDGQVIAFYSYAANLVLSDSNTQPDVFVRDLTVITTTQVSVATSGAQGNGPSYNPRLSADGRYVAFKSTASSLVTGDNNGLWDVFVHDRQTGQTTRVSVGPGGAQANGDANTPATSALGRYVAFAATATNLVVGDTNAASDVFMHDRGP